MADAANAAAAVINYNGGIDGIAADGVEYYSAAIADNLKGGINPKEIVWRQNVESENTQESSNFPPSLNGNGNMNPSQNLVDAFPMLMVILLQIFLTANITKSSLIQVVTPVWLNILFITEVRQGYPIR